MNRFPPVRFLLLACLAVATAMRAAENEFHLVVDLELDAAPASSADPRVLHFNASSRTAGFPGEAFEDKLVIGSLVKKLAPLSSAVPFPLSQLIHAIQERDNSGGRQWQSLGNLAPNDKFPAVLLSYRYQPTTFVIDLHRQGEDAAALPASVTIQATPEVVAHYRVPAGSPSSALADAATKAGNAALKIATDGKLIIGGTAGNPDSISTDLSRTFLLSVRDTAPDYRVLATAGQASGITVSPIFAPKAIAAELEGWKRFEAQYPAAAPKLKAKRLDREGRIREELSFLPGPFSLITAGDVAEWQQTELGKKYGLAPLRYENDTLVLGVADFASEQTYTFAIGASYDATDGLQGTASAHVMHDQRSHFELGIEGSLGAGADSETLNAAWAPKTKLAGWAFTTTATAASRRNDEAHFGATAGGAGIPWRNWTADLGLIAHRDAGEPDVGKWKSGISAGLHLVHSDDKFDTSAVPASADLPDSLAELKAEWRVSTRTRAQHLLILAARAHVAESLKTLDGHYDYHLGEVMLLADFVTSSADGRRPWQFLASSRAGRIRGAVPLSRQFRAGGNDGWIRGLQEGELMGTEYWAQSIAAGPDISSLLGGIGGPGPVFLLPFYDFGRILTDAKTHRTAQGYGVALRVNQIPVGGATAALLLGYARSPDSRLDRHGAFFVRLDLPFVNP